MQSLFPQILDMKIDVRYSPYVKLVGIGKIKY